MLQYFEKNLPLVENLLCALQGEVHIMGGTLLGACDVIQDSGHL